MMSAVIILLVQEGKLHINDPISKYIPDVPYGDTITIEQLLNMRSGLFDYVTSHIFAAIVDINPCKVWQPEQLLKIAFNNPPYSLPDAQYYYSNTNYILLGLVAELIECKPLEVIFQERIFDKFGLNNTILPKCTSNHIPKPYSHGYQFINSSYILLENKTFSPYVKDAVKEGKLQSTDITFLNPSLSWSSGAALSTARDLAIWIKALVRGKVFDTKYHNIWLNSPKPQDSNKPVMVSTMDTEFFD